MSDYRDLGFDQFLNRPNPNGIPQQFDPQQFAIFTQQISGDKLESEINGTLIGQGITADNVTTGQMSFDRAKGGSLILGGQKNQNGVFSLEDENGNEKIGMTKDGMNINDGSLMIKDQNGNTVIDAQGITTSNFANSSMSTSNNTNQQINTVDPTFTLFTNGSINIILKKTTVVLILLTATCYIHRNSGSGDVGANGTIQILTDGTEKRRGFINGSLTGTDSRGMYEAATIITMHYLTTLSSGAHILEVKGALGSVTGDPVLNIYNYNLSYVALGS